MSSLAWLQEGICTHTDLNSKVIPGPYHGIYYHQEPIETICAREHAILYTANPNMAAHSIFSNIPYTVMHKELYCIVKDRSLQ